MTSHPRSAVIWMRGAVAGYVPIVSGAGDAMRLRVAVVTGGSAGVGRAVVRELANNGYDVAVLARGQAGLDGAVKDVENAGARGLAVPTDVSDLGHVRAAAARVEAELGPIDLWVNT